MSVQALAQKLDVSPSNITRLLQTLRDAGYVEKSGISNHYILSNKFYVVANNLLSSNDCVQKYMSTAYRVSEKLSAGVAINSMQGNCSVVLFHVTGHFERIERFIGNLVPAYCSSSGKAMLSQFSSEALANFVKDLEFERFRENTITDLKQLLQEVELAKKDGYAIDREERYAGVMSFSIPLTAFAQLYAFTVIMPSNRQRELFSSKTIEYVRSCIEKT